MERRSWRGSSPKSGWRQGLVLLGLLSLGAGPAPKGIDWTAVLETGCWPRESVVLKGASHFTVTCSGTAGTQFWRVAKGKSGARKLAQIPFLAHGLAAAGGSLYFQANDREHGEELWRLTPPKGQPVLVKDLRPEGGSIPIPIASLGKETLLFSAYGADGSVRRLWRTEGEPKSTRSLVELEGHPRLLSTTGKKVRLFEPLTQVDNFHGGFRRKIWRIRFRESDGSAAGTRLTGEYSIQSRRDELSQLTPLGGRLFFLQSAPSGVELRVSDGSEEGSQVLAVPGLRLGSGALLAAVGESLFLVNPIYQGFEVWKSDGSATGTTLLRKEALPATTSRHRAPKVERVMAACGKLYLVLRIGSAAVRELWESDGSAEGTRLRMDAKHPALDLGPTLQDLYGPRCVEGAVLVQAEGRAGKLKELILLGAEAKDDRLIWHRNRKEEP